LIIIGNYLDKLNAFYKDIISLLSKNEIVARSLS